ncbi:increased DNA methylation 1-like [Humulus lupulus]|uniref:increased DNA methylation 1-like n=1 Tax=Humulus lupulus TaxID=3486 RepID=UPI002B40DDD4|nr:increased DNA methylation 1-like [Humulus lupulus]
MLEKVYVKLQRIVGVKNEMEEGLSWTLIRHTDMMSFDEITDIDLFYQLIECNCKIGIAWSLMDQSFEKIIDRYTGINLLRSVVCNASSNLSRINFRSFYTAILEKDDDIVAVASNTWKDNGGNTLCNNC